MQIVKQLEQVPNEAPEKALPTDVFESIEQTDNTPADEPVLEYVPLLSPTVPMDTAEIPAQAMKEAPLTVEASKQEDFIKENNVTCKV